MIKSLVTGAAGFIGSHLCERLLKEGHSVIGIDNLVSGHSQNLAGFIDHPNFNFTQMPIEDIQWLVSKARFDYVFHLAARADIVPSIEAPEEYHEANVTETIRLLEACRHMPGLKKFVYAASSSCYGIPEATHSCTSEYAPIKCEYPYALTKNVGEQYVMHWNRVYGVPAISLRLFNVYGPRARTKGAYGAVFGVLLSQLANGLPVTIVGNGKQRRDFTYVSDVCEAFVLAAGSLIAGEVLNIGSGGSYAVEYVAQRLGATNRVYVPKRPGEPEMTFADISKARYAINYDPKVTIEIGCEIMKGLISEYKDAPLWTPEKIEKETKLWFELLGEK